MTATVEVAFHLHAVASGIHSRECLEVVEPSKTQPARVSFGRLLDEGIYEEPGSFVRPAHHRSYDADDDLDADFYRRDTRSRSQSRYNGRYADEVRTHRSTRKEHRTVSPHRYTDFPPAGRDYRSRRPPRYVGPIRNRGDIYITKRMANPPCATAYHSSRRLNLMFCERTNGQESADVMHTLLSSQLGYDVGNYRRELQVLSETQKWLGKDIIHVARMSSLVIGSEVLLTWGEIPLSAICTESIVVDDSDARPHTTVRVRDVFWNCYVSSVKHDTSFPTAQTQSNYAAVTLGEERGALQLSFVTSFFGMNTADVRDMKQSSRLYWAVAVPVTCFILGAAYLYGEELTQRITRKTWLEQGLATIDGDGRKANKSTWTGKGIFDRKKTTMDSYGGVSTRQSWGRSRAEP
ncbi:hypothetical protein PWT90_07507 [Aphanocladium album]|nr:hypothetical protein PWT90_07507 [Aphanocladium album]